MRLKQYTNANNVLQEAISIEETNSSNIENMRRIVELYTLMGKVYVENPSLKSTVQPETEDKSPAEK